jgi:uncharacterized Zn finger protein/superfamily II DNA or RNA helicase
MQAKHVFGLTPWGRFFMEAMEALADDGRLARGRSYAGNGAVLELTVSGGLVKAKVEGNYAPFYRVSIGFAPLSEKAAAAVQAEFAADPLLRARIASGELPAGLIERLAKAGASLVPRKWSEITRSCTCPDYGDPCKHQAAVYYLLAQEIDRDPFVLFRLRGIDPGALAGMPSANQAVAARKPVSGTAGKAKPARAAVKPVDFIIPGHLLPQLVEPWPEPRGTGDPLAGSGPLSAYVAAIPAMLPPSRGLAPFDLRVALSAFYHRAASRGTELLAAPVSAAMSGARQRAFARSSFDLIFWPDGSAFIYSPLFPKDGNLEPLEASRQFAACDESDGSPSYRFLRALFRAVRSMVSAGAFVPDIMVADGSLSVFWKPARLFSDVQALLAALEPAVPAPSGYDDEGLVPDPRSSIELLAVAFFSGLASALRFSLPAVRENDHPIARALFRQRAVPCDLPGSRALPGALHAWLSVYDMAAKRLPLELKVAASKASTKAIAKDTTKTGATFDEISYRLSAAVVGEGGSRVALCKAAASGRLSAAGEALAFAALLSNFVSALAKLGVEPWAVLGEKELADFIVDAAPLLGRFGVRLVLPKELKRLATPRPALRATRKASFVTYLDMATAFNFDWTVAIGDERLTPAEFSDLVGSGLALVRWRSEWVRIDPAEAARVLARVSGRKAPGAMEALRTALAGDVELDGELAGAVEFLIGSGRRAADDAPVPLSLRATLRPYQERGYRWMLGNFDRGLGCLLADDMGLGKTVQTIAVMLALKEAGRLPDGALVCAPASLLTNWDRELTKFAPSLNICLYYGASRKLASGQKSADVTLSSYETWIRDQKKLEGKSWSLLVLDEAHYIKNPGSGRAKAVKAIKADHRLALTGTPVENNLAELWSIFDFALPGYLGTLSRFSSEFRRPIELDRSPEAAERLRRATAPFILRRLKTDKAIAADLPDKLVVDEYATLVPAQVALYEAIAGEGLARIQSAGEENRLGLVLALITALKQASNHPRNYDKESSGSSDRSGKARLLVALLESAFESGERVLVFSQYVEMLEILAGVVRDELGVEPYLLHGGMSKKQRDEQVDRFQTERGPGVFLISLKAGGVGLNLTAATRVVHYDLWFNPAVENQATDRAFRIGQTRNVFVHRLITRNTIEERIDAMIASKRELSELTVRSGESWIADLGDAELRELVSLRELR